MMQQAGLEFRGVTKRYGATLAVEDFDLTVGRGELLTLLGPSGSGKTTLLKMLAGFEVPDEGDIILKGRSIATLPPARRNVGMVFQHYALFPHLTVLDNVAYGLRYRGQNKAARRTKAEEMLALVHLQGYGERYPRQLSGGQQQRVAIARALAIEPDVLLMDEPLGALDRQLRLEMEQEIRRLHHELDTTFVYVTHDQEEALTLSDRVAIMRNGRLAGLGAPRALYQRPPNAFVARFFGNANLLPLKAIGLPGEGKVGVVHPPAFSLASTGKPELRIPTRVSDAVFLGETVQLACTPTGPDLPASLTVRQPLDRASSVRVGDALDLFIPLEDIQLVEDD